MYKKMNDQTFKRKISKPFYNQRRETHGNVNCSCKKKIKTLSIFIDNTIATLKMSLGIKF